MKPLLQRFPFSNSERIILYKSRLINRLFLLHSSRVSSTPQSPPGSLIHLENICAYLKEHSSLIILLIQCNTDEDVARIFHDLNQSFWSLYSDWNRDSNLDADSIHLISTFLSSGGYSLICQWLMEDIQKTPKEIAALIFRIINRTHSPSE